MDRNQGHFSRDSIVAFQSWFRIIAITLVLVFALTGVKAVPVIPLALAVIYNIAIVKFRYQVINKARQDPVLVGVDLLIVFLLLVTSGGYKSPYYLYCFSPLMLGGFLFCYRGAVLLAGSQSLLFYLAVRLNGYDLSSIVKMGENIITDYFFFFLVALSIAYLSDLIDRLDFVNEHKAVIESNLQTAKLRLAESLKMHELSAREVEAFTLASEGLTNDEIAHELGISRNTVKTHLSRAYRKLGVATKQEAIARAMREDNSELD